MSEERTVHTIRKPDSTKSDAEIKQENEELTPEMLKARFASVLERGYVNDRLKVDLPPDLHGEWVRHDPVEISDYKSLGFKIDDTYAPKRSLHSSNATEAVIGDVIFMTCPKWVKELIDAEKEKFKAARYNPRKPEDETAYENNVKQSTGGIIPSINNSKTEQVTAEDISEALAAMERQTVTNALTGG